MSEKNTDETLTATKDKNSGIGIATILMKDSGPQTDVNLSAMNEIAAMYLAVKGFTAFMSGFESEGLGPGKIRGILQIPTSELYAVAFDITMKGSGQEEDERLHVNSTGIVCLITPQKQLETVIRCYDETEAFLKKKLAHVYTINDLNESFCSKLKEDFNQFLEKMRSQKLEEDSPARSLYELEVLLSLPKEENLTARAIMQYMGAHDNEAMSLADICKITKRSKEEEQKIVDSLLQKGLLIALSDVEKKEQLLYVAH
ncbi:MAG: hypothetical protein U9O98_04450 [Asgard group archaeon]|nr:hypothetical protein [Asgard group archaeon]